MDEPFDIEIEPEVRLWLMNLSDADYLVVEHVVGLLMDSPTTLAEPYARHLGDGVRELRFSLGHDRDAVRIAYWLPPGRRIVLLTVFRKAPTGGCASGTRETRQGRMLYRTRTGH